MRSEPRGIFGVHSVTAYDPSSGEFYGTAEVVGEASIKSSGELIELMGGASKYPYKVEDGKIDAEVGLKLREYPNFLFELFAGRAPTVAGADANGSVSALTNKKGTSVVNASTGIASIAVKSANKADLKFGRYLLKAMSATTFHVYASNRLDFKRGTIKDLLDDANRITESPLTITASTATEIPGFGLEITGGSGTIGITAGDTAIFDVKPPSKKSMSVKVGSAKDVYKEFGLIIVAQQQGTGEMFEIDVYRAKGIGLPLGFSEKAWSEAEINIKAFYDSIKDGVFEIRNILPESVA